MLNINHVLHITVPGLSEYVSPQTRHGDILECINLVLRFPELPYFMARGSVV